MKILKTLGMVALVLFAAIGVEKVAVLPIIQSIQATQTPTPVAVVAPEPVQKPHNRSVEWVEDVILSAHLTLPAGTEIEVSDSGNCGSEKSAHGTGGGCTYTLAGGVKRIVISPSVIGNPGWGKHVVLHETGHVFGLGECEAEYFAHAHGSALSIWGYPACAVTK